MITTGQLTTEIIEATQGENGKWIRLEDLTKKIGTDGLTKAITDLLDEDETFRAEQEIFPHRASKWDRTEAPRVGGQRINKVAFFW
jgi:hypothetical protein